MLPYAFYMQSRKKVGYFFNVKQGNMCKELLKIYILNT